MKKKLYLANPYGFSKQTSKLLTEFKEVFNELGIEVFEPFEKAEKIIEHHDNWAYAVAKSNYDEIANCDCIFAIVNGSPPDDGVMIEIGIGIALKKDIFLFRDDFRTCKDNDVYPLNLMVSLALPIENWEKNYITNITEIKSLEKNFIKWLKE